MNKNFKIEYPTQSEIKDASSEYSQKELKYNFVNSNIKQIEIERNFEYGVNWLKKYLKSKNL